MGGDDERVGWEEAGQGRRAGCGWRAGWLGGGGALADGEGAVSAGSGGDWRELDAVLYPNEHGVDWSFQ